jgi:hypothetical protein
LGAEGRGFESLRPDQIIKNSLKYSPVSWFCARGFVLTVTDLHRE